MLFRKPTKAMRDAWNKKHQRLEEPLVTVLVGTADRTKTLNLQQHKVAKTPAGLQNEIFGPKRCIDDGVVALPKYEADSFEVYFNWLDDGCIDVCYGLADDDVLEMYYAEVARLAKAIEFATELGDETYLKAAKKAYEGKLSLINNFVVHAAACEQAIENGIKRIKNGIQRIKNGIERIKNDFTRLLDGLSRLGSGIKKLLRGAAKEDKCLKKTIPL